jgi:hypothetical protein
VSDFSFFYIKCSDIQTLILKRSIQFLDQKMSKYISTLLTVGAGGMGKAVNCGRGPSMCHHCKNCKVNAPISRNLAKPGPTKYSPLLNQL